MKLRRILTVFVAVLLISLAAVISVSADEGQFEIAVGVSSSTAIFEDGLYNIEPGDEIELTVSINENPGITSFDFRIKYDPTLVTPVLKENGDVDAKGAFLSGYKVKAVSTDNTLRITWFPSQSTGSSTETGTVTVKFEATDKICENIIFTVSTLEANSGINSLAGSAKKNEINNSLASYVFAAHNYELADTTPPTCTDSGVNHYACSGCDVKVDKVGDAATGHTPTPEEDKQTSCSEPGYIGGTVCSVCGARIHDRVEIPTIDHHVVTVEGKAATCIDEGLTDGKQCSSCKTWIEEQTVIPITAHTPVDVKGQAATCTENGLTDGKQCSVCKEWITPQEIIPAAHGELSDNDGDKVCSVCGVVVEAKKEPATEPVTDAPEADDNGDDDGKKGCKSAIGAGAIVIILASFVSAYIIKRKEN